MLRANGESGEGKAAMKPIGFVAGIALLLALPTAPSAPAFAADDGTLCANPKQLEGFKTCADVAKAEEEGEVVIYSTNPEAGEAKVLAVFKKMFPKIKTNYVRLQAGAL
jgi:iron(III) transport system substrate-binding protein